MIELYLKYYCSQGKSFTLLIFHTPHKKLALLMVLNRPDSNKNDS